MVGRGRVVVMVVINEKGHRCCSGVEVMCCGGVAVMLCGCATRLVTIDVADMMGELLAKRLTVKTVEIKAEVVV